MTEATSFKLTYSTMFNPPEELHTHPAEALEKIKTGLGREYPMLINGQERFSADKHYAHSPINTDMHLATFPERHRPGCRRRGSCRQGRLPAWSRMNWEERVFLLRVGRYHRRAHLRDFRGDGAGGGQKPHGILG